MDLKKLSFHIVVAVFIDLWSWMWSCTPACKRRHYRNRYKRKF